jgi:hypothetical protein
MRYGDDLTKRIGEELIKLPNVRAVCAKVGIDHSTFYRWLSKHYTFNKSVTAALVMGRDRMNDAAEGVIIRGIQDNNQKAAEYWLKHNDPRYANQYQHNKLYGINENHIKMLNEAYPKDPRETAFESFFEMCEGTYKVFDPGKAKIHIDKFVKFMCHGDDQLEDIFYAAYAEWQKDKDEYERKKSEFPDEYP